MPCCNDLKHGDEERDKRQSHSPKRESKSLAQHLDGEKAVGPTSVPISSGREAAVCCIG
jgi:hypothetical protein